jgi:hypothetical protein
MRRLGRNSEGLEVLEMMKRTLLFLAALGGFVFGGDSSRAQQPVLAQPGFVDHRQAIGEVLFQFSSTVDRIEPGAWGALLITEEQGRQLSEVFLAYKKQEEELPEDTPSSERQQMGHQFRTQLDSLMQADQIDTVKLINTTAREILDSNPGLPASEFKDRLMEALKSQLTAEQYQNMEATSGYYPNGILRAQ